MRAYDGRAMNAIHQAASVGQLAAEPVVSLPVALIECDSEPSRIPEHGPDSHFSNLHHSTLNNQFCGLDNSGHIRWAFQFLAGVYWYQCVARHVTPVGGMQRREA